MVQEVDVNGRLRQVHVHRVDGRFVVTVDRREWTVDAVHVDRHTLSLLLVGPTFRSGGPASPTLRSGESPIGPTVKSNELGRSRQLKLGPGRGPTGDDPTNGDPTDVGSGLGRVYSHEVTIAPDPASGGLTVKVGETPLMVSINGRRRWGRRDDAVQTGTGPQRVVAPMPGKVVRVVVKKGEAVQARQAVIVIEAMKMENELRAAIHGTMAEIHVREGQSVEAGALLAVIERGAGQIDPPK